MVKIGETIVQTGEDYNAIPRIRVKGAFIKEVEIDKQLMLPGDTKGNPPIYEVKIRIIDSIGGRHEVTTIEGICKSNLEIRI